MLTVYLILLLIGGTLIGVSLIFGGDADVDADADFDADADADIDADGEADGGHGIAIDAAAWLPFASVRFWLFFMTFFGLTGTLLTTVAGVTSSLAVAVMATVTGYFCGIGASATVKWLMRNEADSAIRASDLIGARARVLLAVREGGVGKVRLSLKGQIIDVRATTEDGVEYPIGSTVMAYDSRPDG
ncbi:MAG: DUF1449 family protein, partial [Deltaproteobacteria bacterium]|nr:DUF1449 family protein [Deltaproteobacteria bacterium]